MKKIFSREYIIKNINLFKIHVNGTKSRELLQQMAYAPFGSLENSSLRFRYNFLKENYKYIILSPQEKILLSLVLTKPTFDEAVRELPHLFYHTLRTNKRLYTIPSNDCFQPRDCKLGDLIVCETNERIEVKTYSVLGERNLISFIDQYKFSRFNSDLTLSILFKDKTSNDIMSNSISLELSSIGFQLSNCFFLSQSNLESFKDDTVFERVLNLYGISRFAYAAEHLDVLQKQLLHVKENTVIQGTGINRMLNQIEKERAALSCPFFRKNPFRLKKNQLLHDIVNERCLEQDPSNIFEEDFLLSDDDSSGFFDVD